MKLQRTLLMDRPYIRLDVSEVVLTSMPRKVPWSHVELLMHRCVERAGVVSDHMANRTEISESGGRSGARLLYAANEKKLQSMAEELVFIAMFELPEQDYGLQLLTLEEEAAGLDS